MAKKDRRQGRPDSRDDEEAVERRKIDRRSGTRERTIPHPIGTKVNLKFELPGKEGVVETTGEVVSTPGSAEGLGAGVKFLNLDPVEKRLIEEFIKESLE